MSLTAGDKLGPYEILTPIGKGGMGEVYRAHDPRTGRDVAIKVSAERFSERFDREVRAVAALNHPNICTLFDVGPDYLVMEFIEGEAPKGPLPLEEALRIARQIAEALEAAHDKGITHRDLKPGNIKITPDGTVKVLDFGLAKMDATSAASPSENSPTLSMAATQAGVILGTAAYMAPEQAKGKQVDKRADIWAFGVVLYEILTGKRLFQGEDITDTLAAVVMKEPDLSAVPAKVRLLLQSCLQKDTKKRLQAIGDARLLLETSVPTAPSPSRPGRLPWMIGSAVATLAAIAVGAIVYRNYTEETRILKVSVVLPEKAKLTAGTSASVPAVSPDGRRLALVAERNGRRELWVRDLDSLTARLLPGTQDANDPFWSPDNRFLAFFAEGKLKKIDITGGPPSILCVAALGRGGTWNKNGVIVFAPEAYSSLFRVSADGGTPVPITQLDESATENSHRFPWFLPDGRHFLYTVRASDVQHSAVFVGDLESKSRHAVVSARSNAVYSPPAYLLYMREQTLVAQSFDAGSGRTTGSAVEVAADVDGIGANYQGQFSASQTGVLAYSSGSAGGNVQLNWVDRSGKITGTVGTYGLVAWAAISPDGNTIAMDRADPQTAIWDIWFHDLVRGTDSRFTLGGNNQWMAWSPDGVRVAFRSSRDAVGNLYERARGVTAQDQILDKQPRGLRPDDWSLDGRYIIEEGSPYGKTGYDILLLPTFGDKKPIPYLQTEFNERWAKLSPNGQWLAYTSDKSKRDEVYVSTFPTPSEEWTISTNGGDRPIWSKDGKELYFLGADQKMMAVPIAGSARFQAGTPKPIFDTHLAGNVDNWFDISKDGHFLIPTQTEYSSSLPLTVVVNWAAGLRK